MLGDAARVAGLEVDLAAGAADELARAEILADGEPLSFAHPIVREAIYADLPAATRGRDHLETARLLAEGGAAPEATAAHLLQAPRGGEAWVIAALRSAATRAGARGAPDVAARYLRRALEEGAPPEDRGPILVELGLAATMSGDPEGANRILEGVEAMDDPAERAKALLAAATILGVRGRYSESARLFERAGGELSELAPESAGALRGWADAGYAMAAIGDLEQRETARPLLRGLADREADERTGVGRSILAIEAMERIYASAPASEASGLARRVLSHDPGKGAGDLVAARIAATALALCGEADEAAAAADRLDDWARRRGSVVEEAGAAYVRALVAYVTGSVGELLVESGAAIAGLGRGWGAAPLTVHMCLSVAHAERGEAIDAAAALELPGGDEPWAEDFLFGFVLEARGRLELDAGRSEDALETFERCGRLQAARGIVNPALSLLNWRSGAAICRARLGDRDRPRAWRTSNSSLPRPSAPRPRSARPCERPAWSPRERSDSGSWPVRSKHSRALPPGSSRPAA